MPSGSAAGRQEISLVEALGGRRALGKNVRREEDLIEQIQEGLPFEALEYLMQALAMRAGAMGKYLGITARTLQRRRTQNILAKPESAQLVRLARIYQRAANILGGPEDAAAWLRHSNVTLGGKAPLDVMDTPLGEERVHELLSRIEHGVYS